MLLRSSSTPVLGSLLPSFGESPSNNHHHHQTEVPSKGSPYFHHNYNYNYNYSKISYSKHAAGSPNLMSSSVSMYNSSPTVVDLSSGSSSSFRRAQSDGNLEALVSSAATSSDDVDEFISSKKIAPRYPYHSHSSTLEPILSFSYRNSNGLRREDEDSEDEEEEEEDVNIEEQTFTTESTNLSGDSLCSSLGNVDFKTEYRRYINVGFGEEMYLAKGLGIGDMSFVCNGSHGGGGSGGGEGCKPVAYDGDSGDNNNSLRIEEHYKRLLEENPSNPLCLRNYAQFLYQTKKDLQSADEYYSRAILADPKDGEVLSQYANLIWEFYRDKERATNYYERAVQASAEDSHVHAAYACFLWEIEDEDGVEASGDDPPAVPALIQEGIIV